MRIHTVVALVAVIATAACDTADDDTELPPVPLAEPAPGAPITVDALDMAVASGEFEAAGDAAGVQGTAELQRRGATQEQGLQLHVRMMGLSEGPHAWHIHEGTCANRAGVVVSLSAAEAQDGPGGDLQPDASGTVDRTAVIDAEQAALLVPGQGYSVNVHGSGGDSPGAPVACATLEIPAQLWGGAGAEMDTVPATE